MNRITAILAQACCVLAPQRPLIQPTHHRQMHFACYLLTRRADQQSQRTSSTKPSWHGNRTNNGGNCGKGFAASKICFACNNEYESNCWRCSADCRQRRPL